MMMRTSALLVVSIWALIFVGGCKKSENKQSGQAEESVSKKQEDKSEQAEPARMPAPTPEKLSSGGSGTQETATLKIDKLTFETPPDWVQQAPGSAMRKAQFRLPAPGEGQAGELVIFHFGPGMSGGPVEANIDRWCSQFKQDDGRDTKDVATVEERIIDGLTVHTVDITGRYVAAMMPGAPEQHNKPDYRMFGAVIDTPKTRYFIKATGPAVTLAAHEEAYEAFLNSLNYQ